jgi:hypothetical protein
MDHGAVRSALSDAVLTDGEMDADWSTFEDRFPRFEDERADHAEHDHDAAEEMGIAD